MGDQPHEACGVCGVYGVRNAALSLYRGLFSLQHRGQEGAGMAVSDGTRVRTCRGEGLVSEVFSKATLDRLAGFLGIGHVRYSTTGSSRPENIQPLVVECVDGVWAVAHNGNLVNASKLRQMYQESGSIFQTSTDSEILLHLLADPMFRHRPGRVCRALAELEGAFSFVLMTADCLMAARDRFGFRPLSVGRLGEGYVVASETCALGQLGAVHERDVEPGELVVIDSSGLHSHFFAEADGARRAHCVFELVYFARPDSHVFGECVHNIRVEYGRRLAREHPASADIVIGIPDSGSLAALGYSRESGIPLDCGFIRNHYIGRTFIMPEEVGRAEGVDLKLAVVPEVVRGRRVVVVDDSIVRGTTARRRVAVLREAGAKEVHMRVSCPPTAHPCFFGIDFPTRAELIASSKSVDEIKDFLGVDSLGYLSCEGLLAPLKDRDGYCHACFTGRYPVDISGAAGKKSLELFPRESVLIE